MSGIEIRKGVVNSTNLRGLIRHDLWRQLPMSGWVETTAGSGTVSSIVGTLDVDTGATASSEAILRAGTQAFSKDKDRDVINWSKRLEMTFWHASVSTTTNGVVLIVLGKDNTNTSGDLANKGIGLKVENQTVKGHVHNGSSASDVSLTGTPTMTDEQSYKVTIISYGTGVVEWFIDDSSVGTSSSGPTGDGTAGDRTVQFEAVNNTDTADQKHQVHSLTIYGEW